MGLDCILLGGIHPVVGSSHPVAGAADSPVEDIRRRHSYEEAGVSYLK